MWPTDSPYAILFASGLLGGLGHCAGMCGPVVAALSLGADGRRGLLPHLLYNAGRLTTYGLLGGAVGASGSFLNIAAGIEPLQKAVMTGTGVLIAVLGLALGGWIPAFAPKGAPPRAPRLLSKALRTFMENGGAGARFPLGMALGLLPCGLVYAALLFAAREGMTAGSPAEGLVRGFLLMTLFGAGTVPSLLVIGRGVALFGARMRTGLYRASGLLMALGGIAFAVKGLSGR